MLNSFQHLSADGLNNIGATVEILAAAEGLEAHKNAVSIRLNFESGVGSPKSEDKTT